MIGPGRSAGRAAYDPNRNGHFVTFARQRLGSGSRCTRKEGAMDRLSPLDALFVDAEDPGSSHVDGDRVDCGVRGSPSYP
jgi:hypothetical protein